VSAPHANDQNVPVRLPAPGPGLDRELTAREELACALRILTREGWRENLSGHITVATDDGGMWCNPWGIWWEEVRASDVLRLDADGNVADGKWDVTPAVFLHTELHRTRPDAKVVVHNHPYYATLLSVLGELPQPLHQNACIFEDEIVFVDEYSGIEDAADGKWLARQVGDASGILLANHGAIVTGPTVAAAAYKAATFERMCRLTYDALTSGRRTKSIPEDARRAFKPVLAQNTPRAYWEGAVRLLLRDEPEVLE
jgi:ribulose-5-phosphate 4-epimerase/fuculose-1-phosphate aldolase